MEHKSEISLSKSNFKTTRKRMLSQRHATSVRASKQQKESKFLDSPVLLSESAASFIARRGSTCSISSEGSGILVETPDQPQRDAMQSPNKKRKHEPNVSHAEQQAKLSGFLENRPSPAQMKRNSLMGRGPNVASNVATAKKLERQMVSNQLNNKIRQRENVKDVQRVMKGGGEDIAPRIQAQKLALEGEFKKNKVRYLLETRPTQEELAQRGITTNTGATSARLVSTQQKLQNEMTKNRVNFLLETRPEREELRRSSILKKDPNEVAPAIQQKSIELEKQLARANLYHGLKHRSSIDELHKKGIFTPAEMQQQQQHQSSSSSASRDAKQQQPNQQQRDEGADVSDDESSSEYSRASSRYGMDYPFSRSKMFHLTRLLFRSVLTLSEQNILSAEQKSVLKDLIIDQHPTILAIAESFDAECDLHDFRDSLIILANRALEEQ